MRKVINGVDVEMTPEEQAGIEAEWAANTPLDEAAQAVADNLAAREGAAAIAAEDPSAQGKALRAVVHLLVQENNLLRQWLEAFKAQTAAASSLVNLQTRVAGLPALPDRTMLQAKNAIVSAIGDGKAD